MISQANKRTTQRQAKHVESAADAVADLARRLHGVCVRLLRRARRDDAAMGLPPGQASALSVLVFGGAKTLSELAAIEQVRAPTMTRMVDALEREGYARRAADAADRRRVTITATPAGVRLLHHGRARREEVLQTALLGLTREERRTLAGALAILERLPQETSTRSKP